MDLIFTHDNDIGHMTFLPPLRKSDHAVILFKLMAEMTYQTVASACPNIWKADMEATNSAASAENWIIGSGASVEEE